MLAFLKVALSKEDENSKEKIGVSQAEGFVIKS